jgi:predicted TIM-barrel fold metal-dependent hydrolase
MVNTPVVDLHAHGGGWKARAFDDDPSMYLRIMDAAGIDIACINSIYFSDARHANDLIAERFTRPYPDRFVGVAFVTPHYPDEALRELDRAFDQLGTKMLKTYPNYFGKPSDDPAYFPIYEWANDRGIAIMCHGTYNTDPPGTTILKRYTAFTQRFPNIKWVIAHSGGGTSEDAGDAAWTLPNVWLETCGSGTSLGGVTFAVDRAGTDRVLFGTDMPILDARQQVGKVVAADISDEDKQKVLGLNAIQLLGLEL